MLDKEQQMQEKYLQKIKGFRLMDDEFMTVFFDDNIEATELVLRIILDKRDLCVTKVKTQKVMKNLVGRDIWLDVNAVDKDGTEYDIELQRADKGADRKRARYHSSIMDAHALSPGDDFSQLPETYVIFITENDVIGEDLPLYHIERCIIDTNKLFDDKSHIVYVNGEMQNDETDLGRLMQDFYCTNPDDMHYNELAEKVRYLKESTEGVATVKSVVDEIREETKIESAKKFLELGTVTVDEIANGLDLPVEVVKELKKS